MGRRCAALTLLLGAATLGACARPPASAYFTETGSGGTTRGAVGLGSNATGEPCRDLPGSDANTVNIYCGAWQQPAAHVLLDATPTPPDRLPELATSSHWRAGLELRFACTDFVRTTILGSVPAVVLRCTRRVGGWPQLAVAATIDGRTFLADGIVPALPVMERAIGVLSGRVSAQRAAELPEGTDDALLAEQLAAKAYTAANAGDFDRLMTLGARGNLSGRFTAAETAYRAALVLEQKVLGRDSPDTVTPMLLLALQISDQGRYAEADQLFGQADTLASSATDLASPGRLLHYRALHALNQGRYEAAADLLARAEQAYAGLIPPDALTARVAASTGASLAPDASPSGLLPSQQLLVDPTAQSALMGIIETRRYRGIVQRLQKHPDESRRLLASAEALAASNGMEVPIVSARLSRTLAMVDAEAGNTSPADSRLGRSAADFSEVLPQSRTLAETELLRAGQKLAEGDPEGTLVLCRTATALLRRQGSGTDPVLLDACLNASAASAEHAGANRQHLLSEMFETAELAQDSLTGREVAEAAARLAEHARDPKVADAIRRRQDAGERLTELARQRDALATARPGDAAAAGSGASDLDALNAAIAKATAELGDADAVLQTAAPNYGQLVQQVVPAAKVLSSLGAGEAFAAVTLTGTGGWSFLLRDGHIDVARVVGGTARMKTLVKRVRRSTEPLGDIIPSFDIAAAHEIYTATLGQFGARLEGVAGLIVAPSGPLLALPFSLLLTDIASTTDLANAPWLLRRMTVAQVPAAANFVSLRAAGRSSAPRPWFGFGDFKPVSLAQAAKSFPGATCSQSAEALAGLPLLTGARQELEQSRLLLGAAEGDQLLGTGFTAKSVRAAPLKQYRILHFATHALLPSELRCETEPAIVTSTDSSAPDASGALLTASAIIGLDLDADAIILSACNSGGGSGGKAESLSGLARAFFYAGARSMLVTHWSISDAAAQRLVVETLRQHQTGLGLAASLRNAQLAMLADAGGPSRSAGAHPFSWAAFSVIGEGGEPSNRAAQAATPVKVADR